MEEFAPNKIKEEIKMLFVMNSPRLDAIYADALYRKAISDGEDVVVIANTKFPDIMCERVPQNLIKPKDIRYTCPKQANPNVKVIMEGWEEDVLNEVLMALSKIIGEDRVQLLFKDENDCIKPVFYCGTFVVNDRQKRNLLSYEAELPVFMNENPRIVIVTKHVAVVQWLEKLGITGDVITEVTSPDQIKNCYAIGNVPIKFMSVAESIGIISDFKVGKYDVDLSEATLERYRVAKFC